MIEQDLNDIRGRLGTIEGKIDKLIAYIIPTLRDVSKHLAEAKELANKGKPPRKQPKKKFDKIIKEEFKDYKPKEKPTHKRF